MALALSVTACSATWKPQPPALPKLPPPPALSEPLPLVPYSTSAQERIKTWREKLNDTQTMSKP